MPPRVLVDAAADAAVDAAVDAVVEAVGLGPWVRRGWFACWEPLMVASKRHQAVVEQTRKALRMAACDALDNWLENQFEQRWMRLVSSYGPSMIPGCPNRRIQIRHLGRLDLATPSLVARWMGTVLRRARRSRHRTQTDLETAHRQDCQCSDGAVWICRLLLEDRILEGFQRYPPQDRLHTACEQQSSEHPCQTASPREGHVVCRCQLRSREHIAANTVDRYCIAD